MEKIVGVSGLESQGRSKLWLAPNTALVIAAFIALAALIVSVWIVMHQPWLGVSLVEGEQGLRIDEVADNGPAASILSTGDVILAIADQKGHAVRFQAQDIIEDADNIPTLKERSEFLDRQSAIYRIMKQPVVELILQDGRTMRIQPQAHRPLNSLPVSFWWLALYGITAILVGTMIWSIKRKEHSARYLLVSGLGVVCLLNTSNIFTSRELALDGVQY